MVDTAIILCGGEGKRLRPLTDNIPKPLVLVNGKPLIEYQFDGYIKFGIKTVILACGYKWEQIKKRYGNSYKDISLIYSPEEKLLGTGGAIKKALQFVKGEEFFVSNCDEIHDLDFKKIKEIGSNVICLSKFRSNFGIVHLNEDGTVKSFEQKPILPFWANMGVYLLNKSIPLPDFGAIETETFPKIKLKAYKHEGFWITVNLVKDVSDAEKALNGEKLT